MWESSFIHNELKLSFPHNYLPNLVFLKSISSAEKRVRRCARALFTNQPSSDRGLLLLLLLLRTLHAGCPTAVLSEMKTIKRRSLSHMSSRAKATCRVGQLYLERRDFLPTERHHDTSTEGAKRREEGGGVGRGETLSGVWFRLPDLFAGCSAGLGL